MFSFCADPTSVPAWQWYACYFTTGKQFDFYSSFGVVIALLLITAPVALMVGFFGAVSARSPFAPLRWIGKSYIAVVRGVPDIAFFMFFVIALDQGIEYVRQKIYCPDWTKPIYQGNDFVVCPAAKMPLASAPPWVYDVYSISLAIITFSIIYGAFAANVLYGAMRSVPQAQLETGEAYGMTSGQVFRRILVPQMWVYALPGLSNLWMILVKATPLLFLLGVRDIVYWARDLGGYKSQAFSYPHPDWRVWYFLGLLIFYLAVTKVSEVFFEAMMQRLSHGQATLGGEKQRKAVAA